MSLMRLIQSPCRYFLHYLVSVFLTKNDDDDDKSHLFNLVNKY